MSVWTYNCARYGGKELREVLSQFYYLCHTPHRWCALFLFGYVRGIEGR